MVAYMLDPIKHMRMSVRVVASPFSEGCISINIGCRLMVRESNVV